MNNKKLLQILDILIDEIKPPYFQEKARKLLIELINDEELGSKNEK